MPSTRTVVTDEPKFGTKVYINKLLISDRIQLPSSNRSLTNFFFPNDQTFQRAYRDLKKFSL